MSVAGDARLQPRGAVLPARGAGAGAVAARARLLAGPAVPRAAAHLHHGHVRADQVRQHQAQDEQQARQPHVAHRVQQLHQAARRAAAAGGAPVAAVARRPRRLLPGAARAGAPAAGQLRRARPPGALMRARRPQSSRDAPSVYFFIFRGGVPRRPPLVISVRFSITFCILVRYVDV